MELLFKKRNRIWVIAAFWVILTILLTTRSSLGQLREFGISFWVQNLFFQGSGSLVWALFTPLIIRFYKRFDFSGDKIGKVFLAHLIFSVPLAILHRWLALIVDFGARYLTNMQFFDSVDPLMVLSAFKLVVLESAVTGFITYWLIVVVLFALSYYRKSKVTKTSIKEERPDSKINQLKVRVDGAYKLIPVKDIVSFEASGNYINLQTTVGQFRLRETMSELEKKMDLPFIRVHRSSMINLDYLDSFQHLYQGEYLLKLKNGKQLTSTKAYRENLLPVIARS